MHIIRNHAEADKLGEYDFDNAPSGTFLEIWTKRTARRIILLKIYPWSVFEGTIPFVSPSIKVAVRTWFAARHKRI